MTHTEYEKLNEQYLELVNRKKQLEQQIIHTMDEKLARTLREDYRALLEKISEIYQNNISYFNSCKS